MSALLHKEKRLAPAPLLKPEAQPASAADPQGEQVGTRAQGGRASAAAGVLNLLRTEPRRGVGPKRKLGE